MGKGWAILEPLAKANPLAAVDQLAVDSACDALVTLNGDLRKKVGAALRKKGFNRWADGLEHGWAQSEEQLFNAYFSNRAYSFSVPSSPPDPLDGCRMAIVFHLSCDLQMVLLEHLRGVPSADVTNAADSPDPDAFRRTYRFTNLLALVVTMKSVQYDVEDFAFRAEDLLVGVPGTSGSFRSSIWPFDADIMSEQVLLGFARASTHRS